MKRHQIDFENDTETELKIKNLRYFKSAKTLLDNQNSKYVKDSIRGIINEQANDGRTPLHIAATDWPQSIIKSLLMYGADLSIQDNNGKCPLSKIPQSTIKDVLDNHCLKSKSKTCDLKLQGLLRDGSRLNGSNLAEDLDFQELVAENDPRFLTNIVKSPVIFDFRVLAPKRTSSDSQKSEKRMSQSPISLKADSEMSVLSEISKSNNHQNLLTHPVIKSYVWLKWYRSMSNYHSELRTSLLMAVFLTWYILSQFGGLEMNHKCQERYSRMFTNASAPTFDRPAWNDKLFCEYYHAYKLDLENDERNGGKYGASEALPVAARIKKQYQAIFGIGNTTQDDPNERTYCMYAKIQYFSFVLVAFFMFYWMVSDIKALYFSSNPFLRRVGQANKNCWSKFRPLIAYLRDFSIVILVLKFSEGMIWIMILFLFLTLVGHQLSRTFFQVFIGYKSMPLVHRRAYHVVLMILIFVVVYVPNEYIYDPLFYSQPEQNEILCPNNGKLNKTEDDLNITVHYHVQVKRGLAAFIIVLSWTNILFQIARHPGKRTEQFNKYVQMYLKVAKSFFRLIMVYFLFLIAFALGFYIMFHNDIGTDKLHTGHNVSLYRFFETPLESMAKTIAMFAGEVDFNNMPIGLSYERRDGNISVFLRYLFFILFIFMVVMVLMNLLNGLAITDITKIVEESEAEHQKSMINILKEIEDMARSNEVLMDFFSNKIPCLKSVFKMFGSLDELSLLPNMVDFRVSNNFDRGPKGLKSFEISPGTDNEDDSSLSELTRKSCFPTKNKSGEKNLFGCEHILKEAQQILLRRNQQKYK